MTTFKALEALGVGFSIDDFGTGYSSLSYLHRFPIDTLKIDRSFIARINSDRESVEIVRTIADLGKNLGLNVVPEGIETAEQQQVLETLGCDTGQGWLFSKAVDAPAIGEMLNPISVRHAVRSNSN